MPSFKFHFKKIDWVLYLPSHGNEKRPYPKYGVAYNDRKKGKTQTGRMISLKDVMVHNADRIYGVFAQHGKSKVLALPVKEKIAA